MRSLLWVLWLAGCSEPSGTTLGGTVTVEGESDHSNILVRLSGPTSAETSTTADGGFRFSGLVVGRRYAVVATAEGTREGSLSASAVSGDGEFPPLVFHAVGSLHGRVTRAGAQTGNQGILVSAQGSSGAALTDDSGAFEIAGLAPATYDLGALASGFSPASALGLTVTRGGATVVPTLDLSPAPSGPSPAADLSGKALLTGVGDASGILVTLSGTALSATTAADGSFLLPHPPAGTFALSFDFGPYHETIPQVLALAGAPAFILGDALFPLDGPPLVLPRGRRLHSALIDEFLLSPDGKYLVYRVGKPSDTSFSNDGSLMTVALAGGPPALLGEAVPPGWSLSPDGQRVLYATRAPSAGGQVYDLHTRPVAGGPAVDVMSAAAIFQNPVFSGSYRFVAGDKILVAEPAQGRLSVVPSSGGTVTRLPGAGAFVVSPAGDEVLLHGNCTAQGTCDLLRVPLSGATPTPLMSGLVPGSLSASPGWDHAAAWGEGQIHAVNLANQQVVDTAGSSLLAFTADGQRLIYLTATGDLASLPSDGGASTILVTAGGFYLPRTALSPGGSMVYFQGIPSYQVQRVPAAGGAVETLAGQIFYQFSPQGRWVELIGAGPADTNSWSFSLSGAEGGPVVPIAPSAVRPFLPFFADKLAFDADESHVAYLADDGHAGESGWVEVTSTESVAPTRVASGATGLNGFSPDGGSILYLTPDHSTTLWAAPSDGSLPPVALLEHAWQPSLFNLRARFVSDAQVAAYSRDHQAPFGFQNGLYLLSVK